MALAVYSVVADDAIINNKNYNFRAAQRSGCCAHNVPRVYVGGIG